MPQLAKQAADAATLQVRYSGTPQLSLIDDCATLQLPVDDLSHSVSLSANVVQPNLLRDGLSVLTQILASDLRFKTRDRSDYLAYLLSHGQRTSQAVWDAQKKFLAEKYGEAEQTTTPLDPVLSVTENDIAIEVFSQDESMYAKLQFKAEQAYQATTLQTGTTRVALPLDLLDQLQALRNYRDTKLEITSAGTGEAETIHVPYRWLRAFGQVQSSATLPADQFELTPIDFYNILLKLRLNKAKQAPRALRYELIPGDMPRIVLEPWEQLLTSHAQVYQGQQPKVVRTWGRQRLGVLAPLLPHTKKITVHLVGGGLPAFYVLDLGAATLTVALSGWTDSGWSSIVAFDSLVPNVNDDALMQQCHQALQKQPCKLDALVDEAQQPVQNVRQALLQGLLVGEFAYDISSQHYYHRPIIAPVLAMDKLRYRDQREANAHRLLDDAEQVQLTRIHDIGGEGVEISGDVHDKSAHRQYQTEFTLDQEGRFKKAKCQCPSFRRAGLREGPCEHIMALCLYYARQQTALEQARQTPEGRRLIRAETRILMKRQTQDALTYRVSLDDRKITLRWGLKPENMRLQRLLFNHADQARTHYFDRLHTLAKQGFIDASRDM